MANTIQEERYRWHKPIINKEMKLVESYLDGDIPKELYVRKKDKILRANAALHEALKDFKVLRNNWNKPSVRDKTPRFGFTILSELVFAYSTKTDFAHTQTPVRKASGWRGVGEVSLCGDGENRTPVRIRV
ncbi:hypothetical protein GW937_01105 [Candidatus Kaiserbacteria bacterium]|nr:hypothetical protein [Candidatus Kaiserbacteria bacterium]NCT01908.1 hypothetical protein [Candidatus Parcubacteria bacterium]